MTALTAHPAGDHPAGAHPAGARTSSLRTLLRVDAALCAGTGLLAAVAGSAVAELLGPDVSATAVRIVGVALVVYAVDLALVSRASTTWLRRVALVAGIGNLAWEVATVGLVALGAFSTPGAVVALVLAAVVGGLGVLQLRALRR